MKKVSKDEKPALFKGNAEIEEAVDCNIFLMQQDMNHSPQTHLRPGIASIH
jgi:hypothetical protein